MAAIVRAIFDCVESLLDRRELPSVEALRPESCPLCGNLAHSPGKPLGIVGHGTYLRQVLGVVSATTEAVTSVRRYLCRGCRHTLSVLADQLHPRRWYAAGVILEALRLHLIEERIEAEIREYFELDESKENWRSLRRWRRELLATLWAWLARRLGSKGVATTREEGRGRLRKLLAEGAVLGGGDSWSTSRALGTATVHARGIVWPLGHDPPEALALKLRSE